MIDLPTRGYRGRIYLGSFLRYRPLWLKYDGNEKLINFQVKCTLTNKDIAFEKLRADRQDLLFITYDGEAIPYWIENANSTEIIVWLKFSEIIPGTEIFWLYYGNGNFSGASNGEATFEFFDDFEDGIYTDKWTRIHDITWQESNGYIEQTNDPAGESGANYHGLQSLKTFNRNGGWFHFLARLRSNSNAAWDSVISVALHPTDPGGIESQRDYGVSINTYHDARTLRIYYPGGHKDLEKVHPYNIWYRVEIWYKGSSGFEWKIIREDTNEIYWQSNATDSAASTDDLYVFLGGDNEGMRWDDIRIRKYTDIEPIILK